MGWFRSRSALAPTAEQRLLLRAALLEGDAGRQAWEQWRRQTDIERLDTGSQRLLPQLYRNVRARAAGEQVLERLKGVYRHTWSANGLMFRDLGVALGALARADIRTVVLDGCALVPLYYRDHGARAIDSIAIMIPLDQVVTAVRVLASEGWRPAEPLRPAHPEHYAGQIRLLGARRPLDLLWDPFAEGCAPDIRRTFWSGAEPGEVADVACLTLAPADELLRICVRAARWEEIPPFRRLADAYVLLGQAWSRVDWHRLARQAVRARVLRPVRATLALLGELLDAPVPERALRQLQSEPSGAGEWFEQRLREAPRGRLGRLPDLLVRYPRLVDPEGGPRRPGIVRYLQEAWGLRSAWEVPLVAIAKGVRRAIRPGGAV